MNIKTRLGNKLTPRMLVSLSALIFAVCAMLSVRAGAEDDAAMGFDTPVAATVSFVDVRGQSVGKATLDESDNGVLVRLALHGLPPGDHAIHIHERADCSPVESHGGGLDAQDYFSNAGGHLNPEKKSHGLMHNDGPHPGDLPNIHVDGDGTAKADLFTDRVTLNDADSGDTHGRAILFDQDGAAIVIHQGTDDYESQPTGNAGARIACAPIKRD